MVRRVWVYTCHLVHQYTDACQRSGQLKECVKLSVSVFLRTFQFISVASIFFLQDINVYCEMLQVEIYNVSLIRNIES